MVVPSTEVAEEYHYSLWQNQNYEWADIGNIKGGKGDTGDTGAPGTPGEKGDTGAYTKATKVINASQAVEISLVQSTYYELTHNNILAITLILTPIEEGTVGEFLIQFTINKGNTPPPVILPTGVAFANGWTQEDFEPGYRYLIYIINDMAFVSYREV